MSEQNTEPKTAPAAPEEPKKFGLQLSGMPWPHAVVAIILCAIPMYWGRVTTSMRM